MGKIKAAIDFETYYEKGVCSVVDLGVDAYLTHPDFDAYMVSFYDEHGDQWVGHPRDFDWKDVAKNFILYAHNQSFELAVIRHLITKKIIPKVNITLQCTADMSAYHGWGRSLEECMKNAFGIELPKSTRTEMSGKRFDKLTATERNDLEDYAIRDAKACLMLALKGMDSWPDDEKELSQETTRMCHAGVPVDPKLMDEGISHLREVLSTSLDLIPWTDVKKGAKSPIQWNKFCRERGKVPPKSMAKDNDQVLKWIKENPEEGAVLKAIHTLGGANTLLEKVKKMRERIRPDGRLPYGLKYFGASPTGRDSGDSGFNMQNLPRDEMYGFNLRNTILAPPGKCFLSADYGQIEARCCAYLAGEWEILELANELDWYESMARAFKLYDGLSPMKDHDAALRHVMKQMCLGCQYKMGVARFAAMTGQTEAAAASMVKMFRAKMPGLSAPRTGLWDRLKNDMTSAFLKNPPDERHYIMVLPSGRELRYENVQIRGGLSAEIIRNGSKVRLRYWEGTLIENATQAFARDVFMNAVLRLRRAGHNIVMRIHDEVLIEADEKTWKEEARQIEKIMMQAPEWCQSLPLATEVTKIERYTK